MKCGWRLWPLIERDTSKLKVISLAHECMRALTFQDYPISVLLGPPEVLRIFSILMIHHALDGDCCTGALRILVAVLHPLPELKHSR